MLAQGEKEGSLHSKSVVQTHLSLPRKGLSSVKER
jgi:hypothetical protein